MDDNAHWVMGKHPGEDDIRFFFYPLPRLVLEHPIDPKNYVDRQFAKGTPLTWRDDITGQLQAAFMAYLNHTPAPEQLQLVIAYLQYHIHAPCWLETWPLDGLDDEIRAEIMALRELSLMLKTIDDVHQYLRRAMEIGLDPL